MQTFCQQHPLHVLLLHMPSVWIMSVEAGRRSISGMEYPRYISRLVIGRLFCWVGLTLVHLRCWCNIIAIIIDFETVIVIDIESNVKTDITIKIIPILPIIIINIIIPLIHITIRTKPLPATSTLTSPAIASRRSARRFYHTQHFVS